VSDGPPDPEEAHARRLYVRALIWGVVTLALLWWFKHHWQV
jgi:hypothetical protein